MSNFSFLPPTLLGQYPKSGEDDGGAIPIIKLLLWGLEDDDHRIDFTKGYCAGTAACVKRLQKKLGVGLHGMFDQLLAQRLNNSELKPDPLPSLASDGMTWYADGSGDLKRWPSSGDVCYLSCKLLPPWLNATNGTGQRSHGYAVLAIKAWLKGLLRSDAAVISLASDEFCEGTADLVRLIQLRVGAEQDGNFGPATRAAIKSHYGLDFEAMWHRGALTMYYSRLNEHLPEVGVRFWPPVYTGN